jgi:hypothetical protein
MCSHAFLQHRAAQAAPMRGRRLKLKQPWRGYRIEMKENFTARYEYAS